LLNLESKQVASRETLAAGVLKLGLPLMLALAPAGALSDQLVWVLGSFSDADTAQQVAQEVHELTGRSGFMQTAVVNGRKVHRALIDPGATVAAQARTTALLSDTVYNQTWGFELNTGGENVKRIGAVVMNQSEVVAVQRSEGPNSEPPLAQPAAGLNGRQGDLMKQADAAGAERNLYLKPASDRTDAADNPSDYHPIRLKSGR